jgi:hypothetical protein
MTDHLELWHSVERTDPAHVKEITGKQYKGNSPKPHYIIMKATETFGPCGIGWGFTIDERVEDGALLASGFHERMSIAKVKVWYKWNGERGEVEHIGGTPFSGQRSNGKPFTDEDAVKKSVTDALVKALSMLGFAGDIFMGRYDDSKYVNELRIEEREKDREAKRADDPAMAYVCKAKSDIQCYATPGELRAWWESDAKERERNGVNKGTKAYDELWSLFVSTGKRLSSKQEAA